MEDPVKKQYWILSAIFGLLIGFILNFAFFELFSGTFLHGFHININDMSGFKEFISRVINSIICGVLLVAPIYYFFNWLNSRRGM